MKELFEKILIIFLSISLVSTFENSSTVISAVDLNCTAECWQDRQNLGLVYSQRIGWPFCEDFYTYACKNFQLVNETFENGYLFDSELVRGGVKATKLCNKIIEESLNTTNNLVPYKLIKSLYKSCKDYEDRSAPANTTDLHFLLEQLSKLGGWPVLEGENWNEEAFDWKKIVIESQNTDKMFNVFIDFNASQNMSSVKSYFLKPMPIDDLYKNLTNHNETQLNSFLDYMIGVAKFLGADEKIARKDLKDSLEFELELINLINNSTSNSTENVNKMSIGKMIERWPSVNWTEFFENLMQSSITVDNSTIITLENVDYVDNLMNMITRTSKRVQANYGLWKMVMEFVKNINNPVIQQLRSTLKKILLSTSLSFNINCSRLVKNLLPLSVDALFVRKYVDRRLKNIVTDMYKDIQRKLLELLRSADWLDEETRRNLVKKIDNIKGFIAYSDDLLDDQKMEEYYADLGELVDGGLLENIVKLKKFNWMKALKVLEVKINEYYRIYPNESIFSASGIDMIYMIPFHRFEMMSGGLLGLQLNVNYPKYIHYGSAGTIIGHELSHALGSRAREFDKLIEKKDWTEKSEQEVTKKGNCFVDQYDGCFFSGYKVNGTRTMEENIADNVGVKIAYQAYQDWVTQNGREQGLPGFLFSPNQLFWLSYANTWCSYYTYEGFNNAINNDTHAPNQVRINQVLKNLPEFSRDFNCPVNSPMNPEKKCSVF